MKASEYIKQNGDFEITEEMKKYIPHKLKTIWDLKDGDIFCWVDGHNEVVPRKWDDSVFCNSQREIGLIALTAEELEFKIEKMKVHEELKRYAKDFTDEEWIKSETLKIFIYFNYVWRRIEFAHRNNLKSNELYFESEEKAKEAIQSVGEERVKKYYLGVGK